MHEFGTSIKSIGCLSTTNAKSTAKDHTRGATVATSIGSNVFAARSGQGHHRATGKP